MKSAAAVPFYANPDKLHCVQAAFRMILKYFLPDRTFSWRELETMSAKLPGKATWPSLMLINLKQMGFDVALIEKFDAQAFIKEGGEYLQREFGPETSAWQIAHSDIPQEQKLYQRMLNSGVTYENRVPTQRDIRDYLRHGYLVKATLNSKRLNHQKGYSGHSVVIYAADDQRITFHDPGLPAREARVESAADFEAAWADPNDQAKELIAITYEGVS